MSLDAYTTTSTRPNVKKKPPKRMTSLRNSSMQKRHTLVPKPPTHMVTHALAPHIKLAPGSSGTKPNCSVSHLSWEQGLGICNGTAHTVGAHLSPEQTPISEQQTSMQDLLEHQSTCGQSGGWWGGDTACCFLPPPLHWVGHREAEEGRVWCWHAAASAATTGMWLQGVTPEPAGVVKAARTLWDGTLSPTDFLAQP